MLEPSDLIGGIGLHALALADSLISSLDVLFSAGMPRGVDSVALVVGGVTGGVGGGGAVYGPPLDYGPPVRPEPGRVRLLPPRDRSGDTPFRLSRDLLQKLGRTSAGGGPPSVWIHGGHLHRDDPRTSPESVVGPDDES
jgi:hypothetical protein